MSITFHDEFATLVGRHLQQELTPQTDSVQARGVDGKLEDGIRTKMVLGDLDVIGDLSDAPAQGNVEDTIKHYFTNAMLQQTPWAMLLPIICLSGAAGTENGGWKMIHEEQKTNVWAFLSVMATKKQEWETGIEESEAIYEKMTLASEEVEVLLLGVQEKKVEKIFPEKEKVEMAEMVFPKKKKKVKMTTAEKLKMAKELVAGALTKPKKVEENAEKNEWVFPKPMPRKLKNKSLDKQNEEDYVIVEEDKLDEKVKMGETVLQRLTRRRRDREMVKELVARVLTKPEKVEKAEKNECVFPKPIPKKLKNKKSLDKQNEEYVIVEEEKMSDHFGSTLYPTICSMELAGLTMDDGDKVDACEPSAPAARPSSYLAFFSDDSDAGSDGSFVQIEVQSRCGEPPLFCYTKAHRPGVVRARGVAALATARVPVLMRTSPV